MTLVISNNPDQEGGYGKYSEYGTQAPLRLVDQHKGWSPKVLRRTKMSVISASLLSVLFGVTSITAFNADAQMNLEKARNQLKIAEARYDRARSILNEKESPSSITTEATKLGMVKPSIGPIFLTPTSNTVSVSNR